MAGFGISLTTLYETHPHILTEILYYCSPTTFDAFRYTCKAVYSMSLDPSLLEHHLRAIVNRQHEIITSAPPPRYLDDIKYMDSKFDTLDHSQGNLWRLRGLILQEFLRMQSSWRVGDYKKVVVTLDINSGEDGDEKTEAASMPGPYFDGTIQLVAGTIRGDVFALAWGDTKETHLHTYRFTNSRKHTVRKIEGPKGTRITHEFLPDKKTYLSTKFHTKAVGRRSIRGLPLNLSDGFDISINEGFYLRSPEQIERMRASGYWYDQVDMREPAAAFLRAKFNGKSVAEGEDDGSFNLAYELDPDQKINWKVPAVSLIYNPNLTLPGHSEETMKLLLGKNGKCESEGYAIGLDSTPHWKWKVLEPRRHQDDVSRLGVWKDVSVEFKRGEGENETVLRVLASVSKNLIKPNSEKRFLLTKSKDLNPEDWAQVSIPLVLPPLTHGDQYGRLVLATVAPAAYFRQLWMRDPEIPWADKGFLNYNWDPKKHTTDGTGLNPVFIRTGAMINRDLVDAEILTRIVGWTDDGAVWVWDITEKHVLDAGELEMSEDSKKDLEVVAKKLGYVKDVKGIFVTGDRTIQKITLLTYGEEQRVHRVGLGDNEENDSGISLLRQEDIMRQIKIAKAKKASEQGEGLENDYGHRDGEGETATILTLPDVIDSPESNIKWRMINYLFGQPKGEGPTNYCIDSSGSLGGS
ncbi:hypothetical protein TWF481_000534 [Arthrobotrys musiformis]|uniref:F-box domain-containing protein n=1 Tax=Arthrobotrys musiformis TaxID=47236 RepID=A0AAV9WQ52_9PEZI